MQTLNILDLFSGVGGFSLGLERTGGFKTVAFCEVDPAARRVLAKHWPGVPIHEDIRTLSKEQLLESIDIICGGFPCQDLSVAGTRNGNLGLEGDRSGLWYEYLRLISEIRPTFALIENVAALRSRGLEDVLRGLDAVGYDAEWHCIPATYVGAAHQRDRVWILAHAKSLRVEGLWAERLEKSRSLVEPLLPHRRGDGQWQVEPDLRRGPYGSTSRLDGRMNSWGDRLKQCGNGIVPAIAELFGHAILDVISRQEVV